MNKIIEKFFTVGEIVKLECKIMFQVGEMYGKVQLIPTKDNIFCKDKYNYVGIFNEEWIGIAEMSHRYKEFMMFTNIGGLELYKYVLDKYERVNI